MGEQSTPGHPDEIELPPVHAGAWPLEMLDSYEQDLRSLATIDEVRVKAAAGRYADEQDWQLGSALDLIRQGKVRGVQVLYTWQGEAWIDTLMLQPAGVKIVRMQAPSLP